MAALNQSIESTNDQFVEIYVRNARTHIENGKAQFTDYEVEIKTNLIAFTLKHSRVRRRYSDFIWLRRKLAKDLMTTAPPTLPGRRLFGRFKKDFIKQRQNKLQNFLSAVVGNNMFLSHSALHLFLQSKLTVKEIEEYIESKGDEDPSETILAGLPLALRLRSETGNSFLPREWSLSSSDSAIESGLSDTYGDSFHDSDLNRNVYPVMNTLDDNSARKSSSDGNSADDEGDGEDDESGVALEDEKEMEQRLKDIRVSCLNLQTCSEDVESSVEYLTADISDVTNDQDASSPKFLENNNESFRPLSRKRRRSKRRKPTSTSQFSVPESAGPRGAVSVIDISEKLPTVRRCYSFQKLNQVPMGLSEQWTQRISRTQSFRSRQRNSFGDENRSPGKRKISLNEYCIVKRDSVLSNCSFDETEFNKSL